MERIAKIEVFSDGKVNVEVGRRIPLSDGTSVKVSCYARYFQWFDAGCTGNPEYIRLYLENLQRYANDLLRARGYLFLNDVYNLLSMPRTPAGQVVGWIYSKNNPIGDNYVDFGMLANYNKDFISGNDNRPLLDFNVDGCILDKI